MDDALWRELGTSSAGLEKLHAYVALVEKWTVRINLIAKSTIGDLWARHIEDSARIMLLSPENPKIWADFGSGGGFPALVVAIILADWGRNTQVILVESDQRKATFLREASRQLGLNTTVHSERAEVLKPLAADVISARALASLDQLCAVTARHGVAGTLSLFPKGETWQQEVALARENWRFDLEAFADPGHKGSAILQLRNLDRASRDLHP